MGLADSFANTLNAFTNAGAMREDRRRVDLLERLQPFSIAELQARTANMEIERRQREQQMELLEMLMREEEATATKLQDAAADLVGKTPKMAQDRLAQMLGLKEIDVASGLPASLQGLFVKPDTMMADLLADAKRGAAMSALFGSPVERAAAQSARLSRQVAAAGLPRLPEQTPSPLGARAVLGDAKAPWQSPFQQHLDFLERLARPDATFGAFPGFGPPVASMADKQALLEWLTQSEAQP